MGGVGITIFTDQNFRGKSSTFREDVPDLEPLGLNDKISSLRVGPGEQWEVCEHSNYQGRCVVVSGLEPDLRRNSWFFIQKSEGWTSAGITFDTSAPSFPYFLKNHVSSLRLITRRPR